MSDTPIVLEGPLVLTRMPASREESSHALEGDSVLLAERIARCGLPASVLPDFRDVFPATTGPVA